MPLLEGVYAAAVTPRRLGMQDINLGVMWELIDFLCERKVQGLSLLGSTGEFVHYSNSERMRMMGLAPKRSRVPVLINVSQSTLDGAVELAQAAAASGAVGVLLMPPHYFQYGDDDVRLFYRRFAREAEIEIPILLYNSPRFGSPVSIDVALELLRDGLVHGMKDASGDPNYVAQLLELHRQQPFTLMGGADELLGQTTEVSGVISGLACAVPELVLAVQRGVPAGSDRIRELRDRVGRMPFPVGIREATAARGLKLGPHAVPVNERVIAEFREWFAGWLPAVLEECRVA
jgi:dihydrodipicolinate synthase/N-acetylneuraminate lyase